MGIKNTVWTCKRTHAISIFVEFTDPAVFGGQKVKPCIQNLIGKHCKFVQSLKGMSRRNFSIRIWSLKIYFIDHWKFLSGSKSFFPRLLRNSYVRTCVVTAVIASAKNFIPWSILSIELIFLNSIRFAGLISIFMKSASQKLRVYFHAQSIENNVTININLLFHLFSLFV